MERLATLALNDQGFVFDPATGTSYTVNPVGRMVLTELRAGRSAEDAAAAIATAWKQPVATATRDVADFVRDLSRMGLV